MGRKKIDMKMVKDSNSRQVTFSKRRNGVFKKAHELATLCAVQVVIIVFSPGGKPYSFGCPTVDLVTDRFMNPYLPPPAADRSRNSTMTQHPPAAADDEEEKEDLNKELDEILKELVREKERGKMIEKSLKDDFGETMFMKPIHKLDRNQAEEYETRLKKLRKDVDMNISEIEASSTLLLLKNDDDFNPSDV